MAYELDITTEGGTSLHGLDFIGTLPGVTITRVAGMNGVGIGHLQIDATGTYLSWCPPGGSTFGSEVDVSGGGEFCIYNITNRKWVEVTVNTDYLPTGNESAAVLLTVPYGDENLTDVFSDVSANEATNGTSDSEQIYLTTASEDNLDVTVWYEGTGNRYGLTKKVGMQLFPCDSNDVLTATITNGSPLNILVIRTIESGAACSPAEEVIINVEATNGTIIYKYQLRRYYRVFNTPEYRFYKSTTNPPVTGIDETWDTNSSLPHQVNEALADDLYYLAATYYNGIYEGGYTKAERLLISGGESVDTPPSAPHSTWLEQRSGGVIRVHARYSPQDGETAANKFAVWYKVGAGTYNIIPNYTPSAALRRLKQDLPTQADDTLITVMIKTLREDDTGVYSDAVEISITNDYDTPAAPDSAVTYQGDIPEGDI